MLVRLALRMKVFTGQKKWPKRGQQGKKVGVLSTELKYSNALLHKSRGQHFSYKT